MPFSNNFISLAKAPTIKKSMQRSFNTGTMSFRIEITTSSVILFNKILEVGFINSVSYFQVSAFFCSQKVSIRQ